MKPVLVAALLVACSAAGAQLPLQLGAAQAPRVSAGTKVLLRTLEPLSTEGKALAPGYEFDVAVEASVILEGEIVIPAGSRGKAEIVSVRNKGMWGKSGGLVARARYVNVAGRRVALTGTFSDRGKTGTWGVIGAAAALPIAGFFTTGTSARLPAGTIVVAALEEDLPVVFPAGHVWSSDGRGVARRSDDLCGATSNLSICTTDKPLR